ncbi:MAG: hypothetical protein PHI71_10530 [Acidiphilium sp.]|nr:hypothetical protein [Acidiphilium sp.]
MNRAWILFRSGSRLDLLNPKPNAWTDSDLAIGLARTYRWGGQSAWDLPLSVAQHSLTVLAIREAGRRQLTPAEAMRELLHDATEALIGGIDPITPIKPLLGAAYHAINSRLQTAVNQRYELPAWTVASHREHKIADRLAAASEAHHVVGWRKPAVRRTLGIEAEPLDNDPVTAPDGMESWEPWPPYVAAERFLARLRALQQARTLTGAARRAA